MSGSLKHQFQGDMMAAVAAFIELEATIKLVEVATLRGNLAEAETYRQKCHDILDQHMDIKQGVIALARSKQ